MRIRVPYLLLGSGLQHRSQMCSERGGEVMAGAGVGADTGGLGEIAREHGGLVWVR